MFVCKCDRAVEAVEYVTIAYGLGTVAEKFAKKYADKEGQQIS